MNALALLLTVLATAGTGPPLRPSWEMIYDGGEGRTVDLVHATARDQWVAAGGRWGLVTARGGTTHVEDTHDHGVLGFFADGPDSLYALGEGELIWHLQGQSWNEEHTAPRPPPGRRAFAEHMLYLGYLDVTGEARPVAAGLQLALVRQAGGTWAQPGDAERTRLTDLATLGPDFTAPERCARAAWRWLGPRRGAFACHDGRLFIWDAGTVTGRGKLPRPCANALGAVVEAGGALFASCEFATLWKSDAATWRRVVPPKEKGLADLPALSHADGCLFVAGGRAVWRTCDR